MAKGGNRFRVKFLDMGKVVGAYCGNRLGGTCAGEGCLVVVIIGSELCVAFRINVRG